VKTCMYDHLFFVSGSVEDGDQSSQSTNSN
jgi:hypothetical protein